MSVKLFLGWLGLLFTLRWLISASSSCPIYIFIILKFSTLNDQISNLSKQTIPRCLYHIYNWYYLIRKVGENSLYMFETWYKRSQQINLFEYGSRIPTEGLQVENVVVVVEAGVARHPVSSPVPTMSCKTGFVSRLLFAIVQWDGPGWECRCSVRDRGCGTFRYAYQS